MKYICIILGLTSNIQSNAQFVLQEGILDVNQSYVDPTIQKGIPSKFDQKSNIMSRKSLDDFTDNTENKRDKSDFIETLEKILGKFGNDRVSPIFRSEAKNIKPEIIHFRNEKPLVMYEIKTNTILKVMKELLASEPVERFMDKVARQAAAVFRSSMEKKRNDD